MFCGCLRRFSWENLVFHQFTKVFSHKSFLLYGMYLRHLVQVYPTSKQQLPRWWQSILAITSLKRTPRYWFCSEKKTIETLFLRSKCSSLSHFKPGTHCEHTCTHTCERQKGQDGVHVEISGFCLCVAHFSQSKLAVFWGSSVVVAVLYCEGSVCVAILWSLPHNRDTCTRGGFTVLQWLSESTQCIFRKRITCFLLHTSLQALLVCYCGAVGSLSL